MSRFFLIAIGILFLINLVQSQDLKDDLFKVNNNLLKMDNYSLSIELETLDENNNSVYSYRTVMHKSEDNIIQENEDFEYLMNPKFVVVATKKNKTIRITSHNQKIGDKFSNISEDLIDSFLIQNIDLYDSVYLINSTDVENHYGIIAGNQKFEMVLNMQDFLIDKYITYNYNPVSKVIEKTVMSYAFEPLNKEMVNFSEYKFLKREKGEWLLNESYKDYYINQWF